ncbi:hypothetical protein GBAR_LOCUS24418 [Geodia barretti]|uniref:Uncharacterized protein n=1 Tax=Geodia barretti TaxID=519541 RepID=A0AA35T9M5_GEOBA|nr:hypothetical protein GBAR_LOCUS24418 [Geodia barretti]
MSSNGQKTNQGDPHFLCYTHNIRCGQFHLLRATVEPHNKGHYGTNDL